MAFAMIRYKLTMKDAMALYGKYNSSWGSKAVVWRFDAIKNGKVVASVTRSASTKLHLEVTASQTQLREGDVYDMAAVRIRILDEFGNPAVYAQLPVTLEISGEAELVGPKVITAEGGMCGTYIRTTGNTGSAQLTIRTEQTEPVTIHFTIGAQQELS
jgi:beta-galactosidase